MMVEMVPSYRQQKLTTLSHPLVALLDKLQLGAIGQGNLESIPPTFPRSPSLSLCAAGSGSTLGGVGHKQASHSPYGFNSP